MQHVRLLSPEQVEELQQFPKIKWVVEPDDAYRDGLFFEPPRRFPVPVKRIDTDLVVELLEVIGQARELLLGPAGVQFSDEEGDVHFHGDS